MLISCVRNVFLVQKTECFECGKSGHFARNCPNKQYQPRKFTGVCLLCGRLGHDVPSCSGEYDPDDFKVIIFFAVLNFLRFMNFLFLEIY